MGAAQSLAVLWSAGVRVLARPREIGDPGANRFTFTGKIGVHKLTPGTYQLTATTAGGSRSVKLQIAR